MCLQHSLKSVIHTGRKKCATQCHDKWKWQVAMEVSMGFNTEIQHKETRADLPSLKLYLSPSSTTPWNLFFSSRSLSQINTSPFQFATVHSILSQRAKNDLISAIAQRSLGIFQRPVIQPHLFGVYTFKWSYRVFLRDSEVKVTGRHTSISYLAPCTRRLLWNAKTVSHSLTYCNVIFSII